MSDDNKRGDELRLCSSCRMEVSVWATKCHHCGEEIGRPKREEAKLTLKDLGGSQRTDYKPSQHVTGALDSFLEEEVAAEASRNKPKPPTFFEKLLGKKTPPPQPARKIDDSLPSLDSAGSDLAASLLDDMPLGKTSARPAPPPPSGASLLAYRIAMLGIVIAGLLFAYFGGAFAWDKIGVWMEERNAPPEIQYINKAPEMMARGELTIDAYEEAMKAVGIKDDEENRKIAGELRDLLLSEVDELLARNPWKLANHDTAYRYVQRAVNVDDHPSVKAKFDEVNQEVAAYKFVLKSIDSTGTKATFRLNHPRFESEATVEVADRLMDRFIIRRISSRGVDLVDDRVEGRKLTIAVNEGVKSQY